MSRVHRLHKDESGMSYVFIGLGLMASPLLRSADSAVPANPKICIIHTENTPSTTPAVQRANMLVEQPLQQT